MHTLGIALLGSGRMAHVYGPKINSHPGLRLSVVFNPNLTSAESITAQYGGVATSSLDQALAHPDVDVVLIVTPANTHLEYVIACAKAGKPTFCEKPLDQSLDRADQSLTALKKNPVPFMLAFNRRFDPDISALQRTVKNGGLGQLSFLMSTSREPAPPPMSYVKSSGGYFVDATIHDIDLMCWIAGELPSEVFAAGSCLTDPEIGKVGDCDTTMTTLKMPSGCLVHINNSRRCAYGFDQRIEAFGEAGMLQTTNQRDEKLIHWTAENTEARAPLKHFFLERYDASFSIALDEFYCAVTEGRTPSCTVQDGRDALAIALACEQARRSGAAVKMDWSRG
jgi:myo-inositol 2-dehydrogenase/D-chiro-inositol 1-dehydrogenase